MRSAILKRLADRMAVQDTSPTGEVTDWIRLGQLERRVAHIGYDVAHGHPEIARLEGLACELIRWLEALEARDELRIESGDEAA